VIDWLTFEAACGAHAEVAGGSVVSFDVDGAVEWLTLKRRAIEGSGSSKVQVRSKGAHAYELSGNLVKFWQGHNVWGTSDLQGLLGAWDRYAAVEGLPVIEGEVRLRRVDVTESYQLGSQAEVLAWLRAAAHSAHLAHRGRGSLVREGTVYWGQRSRRWSLKAYSKQLEVVSTGKAREGSALYEATAGILRLEGTIRAMELTRLGLSCPSKWTPLTGRSTLGAMAAKLTLPESQAVDTSLVDRLPRRLKGIYAEWMMGKDPRALYPRPSAYRYRRELLEHGVDIFAPPAEPVQFAEASATWLPHWDIRKLEPWQPTPEQIATLGYFDPDSYRPTASSRTQALSATIVN